jgi:hypothetical protein
MTQLLENPYEMRAEIWREYPHNDRYLISNLGRAKLSNNRLLKYCENYYYNIKINGINKERSAKSLVRETFNVIDLETIPLENEIWKDIDGHEGYQISSLGRAKSLVAYKNNIEIILNPYIDKFGYVSITIRRKKLAIHRLVAKHFIPNLDLERNVVNHINGNPSDNSIENLEWVTFRENTHHGRGIGKHPSLYPLKGTPYFRVYVHYKGKQCYLGKHLFDEGIKVRDAFLKEKNIINKYL